MQPKQTFLFGYGSLICSKSRSLTCPELSRRAAIPVAIRGLERTWNGRCATWTAMGVRFVDDHDNDSNDDAKSSKSCAGVLVPLESHEELRRFDRREINYRRCRVPLEQVEKLPYLPASEYQEHEPLLHDILASSDEEGSNDDDDDKNNTIDIWVYVPKQPKAPAPERPILQSYVDTILRGCLNVGGEPFAEEFLQATALWHPSEEEEKAAMDSDDKPVVWVNDRLDPHYTRGDTAFSLQNAKRLDKLILKHRDLAEERLELEPQQ